MTRRSKQSSTFAMEGLETRSLMSVTLLSDVNPGSGSSLPENFSVVGNQVLFTAYDPTRGQMLWGTDGTAAGTVLIKDINPNPQNGMYQGYGGGSIVIGNEMYFTGVDSAHGVELWKTDGTAAGTQLVSDLNPGTDGSNPGGFVNFNGNLAFTAMGQLWVTDGTSAGTISLGAFNPGGVDGTIDRMAVLGNSLYFMRYKAADSDGGSTGELWKTDGTVAGTQMVTDVSPGNDGDSTVNPEPSDLINVSGELYFAADDGVHGWELWKSDGTATGTEMVDDLAPPPTTGYPQDGSYPSDLTDVDGTLYFAASSDYSSPELYRIDPSTGAPAVVDSIASGGPSTPQQLVAVGDGVFFTASDGNGGSSLWHSDGTAVGTTQIADINSGNANINAMTAVGSSLYFTADDGTHGAELWSSDGTAAGTSLAADVQPGSDGSSPGPVTEFNGTLVFSADADDAGEEPFALTLSTPTVPTSPVAPTTPTTPTPPAAPTAALTSPFATGLSNNPMPAVTGTAPAGALVYLFADGVAIGNAVADSSGDYQVASATALADGTHELTVTDSVDGLSSSASAPIEFTVDSVHPTISFVSATTTSIVLKFSEDVSAAFGRGDFTLTNIDTGTRISKANIRVSYNLKNNTATIFFKGLGEDALGTGHYRLRVAADKVTDAAGNDLSDDESFGFTIRKKQ